jgi:hypothetical protein
MSYGLDCRELGFRFSAGAKDFSHSVQTSSHVRWVPCHHGMARPQVADGGDALQLWREAANILNKQSQKANKG